MRDMNPQHNPSDNPNFDPNSRELVWYMSHPLAGDDKYGFMENVEHAKHMMRLCFDAGLRVIAPYLSIIEVLDDDNEEHRRIGLETDCVVARKLGRIIMTGHRISRGMRHEETAVTNGIEDYCAEHGYSDEVRDVILAECIIDITELDDDDAKDQLRMIVSEGIGG